MMSSSSTRKNPLIVLMGAVFAGMATFVAFLAATAFLTRIFTTALMVLRVGRSLTLLPQ